MNSVKPVPNRSFENDVTFIDLLPTSWFQLEVKKHPSPFPLRAIDLEPWEKANPPVIHYDKPNDPRVSHFIDLSLPAKLSFLETYQDPFDKYAGQRNMFDGSINKTFLEQIKEKPRFEILKKMIEEEDKKNKKGQKKSKKVVDDEKEEKAIPKKKKAIPKALKASVWVTYVGKEVGMTKCPCCGTDEITQLNFECGHIIAESNGGSTTIDNLRPVCGKCNKSMGVMNMDEFTNTYFPKKA